jgi:hypothetical protein
MEESSAVRRCQRVPYQAPRYHNLGVDHIYHPILLQFTSDRRFAQDGIDHELKIRHTRAPTPIDIANLGKLPSYNLRGLN